MASSVGRTVPTDAKPGICFYFCKSKTSVSETETVIIPNCFS